MVLTANNPQPTITAYIQRFIRDLEARVNQSAQNELENQLMDAYVTKSHFREMRLHKIEYDPKVVYIN